MTNYILMTRSMTKTSRNRPVVTDGTHGMIGRIQSQKMEIIDVTIDNLYGVLLGVIAVITAIIARHRSWTGRCLGNGSRSKVRTDTRISLIWIQRKCQDN